MSNEMGVIVLKITLRMRVAARGPVAFSADAVVLLQRHRRAQEEQRLALGLGHATVGLTLGTYSHVLPDLQRDAAEVMDGVLRPGIRRSARGGT